MKDEKKYRKWLFWFSFAVAASIVYKMLDNFASITDAIGNFFSIIKPFWHAVLIAYLLYLPAKKIESIYAKTKLSLIRNHRRGFSVITVWILVIFIIYIFVSFIFPMISESIGDLASSIPGYYNTTIKALNEAEDGSILHKINQTEFAQKIKDIDIRNIVNNYLSKDRIIEYAEKAFDAAQSLLSVFVTLIVSIYILLERSDIKEFFKRFFKSNLTYNGYNKLARYYKRTNSIFSTYIVGQIFDAILVGTILSIAMTFMKIKYSVVLGFIIGLFNLIPFLGAIIGVGIAILITIFTGGLIKALELGIVALVLQQIDANIINPKILGNRLNISSILIIFGVTVGGAYFGMIGMFLGVPAIALLKIVINDIIDDKLEEKKIQEKQELEDYIEEEMKKYEDIDDFFELQEEQQRKKTPQKYVVHRVKKSTSNKSKKTTHKTKSK